MTRLTSPSHKLLVYPLLVMLPSNQLYSSVFCIDGRAKEKKLLPLLEVVNDLKVILYEFVFEMFIGLVKLYNNK